MLFFQQSKVEKDIETLKAQGALHDSDLLDVPRFDIETYQVWNQAYKVAKPTEERVKQDLKAEAGCPYNWVIDYIKDFNEKSEERMVETKTFLEEFFDQ